MISRKEKIKDQIKKEVNKQRMRMCLFTGC